MTTQLPLVKPIYWINPRRCHGRQEEDNINHDKSIFGHPDTCVRCLVVHVGGWRLPEAKFFIEFIENNSNLHHVTINIRTGRNDVVDPKVLQAIGKAVATSRSVKSVDIQAYINYFCTNSLNDIMRNLPQDTVETELKLYQNVSLSNVQISMMKNQIKTLPIMKLDLISIRDKELRHFLSCLAASDNKNENNNGPRLKKLRISPSSTGGIINILPRGIINLPGIRTYLSSKAASNLESLYLSLYGAVTDEAMTELVSGLSGNSSIKSMYFYAYQMSDESVDILATFFSGCSSLEKLHIGTLDDNGIHHPQDLFTALCCQPSIRELNLGHLSFENSAESVKNLLLQNNTIQDLTCSLWDDWADGAWLQTLSEGLVHNSSLKKLKIDMCRRDAEYVDISPILSVLISSKDNPSRLETVVLSGQGISRENAVAIADTLRNPHCQLKTLELDMELLEDAVALLILTSIEHCSSVKAFHLKGMCYRLKQDTWKAIAASIPSLRLQHLSINADETEETDRLEHTVEDELQTALLEGVESNPHLEKVEFYFGHAFDTHGRFLVDLNTACMKNKVLKAAEAMQTTGGNLPLPALTNALRAVESTYHYSSEGKKQIEALGNTLLFKTIQGNRNLQVELEMNHHKP